MNDQLSNTKGKLSIRVKKLYNMAPDNEEVVAVTQEYISWYNEGGVPQYGSPKWKAGVVLWNRVDQLEAQVQPDLPSVDPDPVSVSDESGVVEFEVITDVASTEEVSVMEDQVGNVDTQVGNTPTQVGSDFIFEAAESSSPTINTQSTPSEEVTNMQDRPNLRTLIKLNTSGRLSDRILEAIERAPDDPGTEQVCRRYWKLWNTPRSEGGRVESGRLFGIADRIIAANPTTEEIRRMKQEAKAARRKDRVESVATLASSLVDGVFKVMDKASESMGKLAEQSARNLGTVAGGVVTGATAGVREFNTARYQNTVAVFGDTDYQNLKLQATQLKVMVRASRKEALRVAKAMAKDAVQL